MIAADIAILIPVISILAAIPFVCYSDIKAREVNDIFWLLLIGTNVPGMGYLYFEGYYQLFTLVTSIVMIGIFYLITKKGLIQQADGIFLSIISLFYIINPWPLPHGSVQLAFMVNLVTMMICTAVIVLGVNIWRGNRFDMVKMLSYYPEGIPFMLPISLAFILTVITA
jgi:hypothetical protein